MKFSVAYNYLKLLGITAGLGSKLVSRDQRRLNFASSLYVRPVPTWLLVSVRYTLAL